MKLTGAQIITRVLIEQGVDLLFGYPGGSVIHLFDALGECADAIRVVLPSHEQGGCFAADGYARVSGRCGVVIATSGPGATNLVTGLANAHMDSVPLVAVTGNVPRASMGSDSFQEVDICGVTMPVTKHNFLVQDVERLASTLREAFEIAISGRPGPVLVDVPKDVTGQETDFAPVGRYTVRPTLPPGEMQVRLASDMIAKSARPLILCGGGVVSSNACGRLRDFAERRGIPVTASLMGLTALASDHTLMLGMAGMHGTPVSNYAGSRCDLLIAVGSRFSDRIAGDRTRFVPDARLIHIDIDPSEFDKNVVCDLHIEGDAAAILGRLCDELPEGHSPDWLAELREFAELHPIEEGDGGDGLSPRAILRGIASQAGEAAIIVTDVGQHQMWTAQHYPLSKPRSLVTSGGLGAMGYGMGAAIGAKAASPGCPVVLVTGDGSFHMGLPELATAVTEELPVVVVVMDNGVLGMVRQWQHVFYGARHPGTTLNRQTDYVKLAQAFGALGFRAETPAELNHALGRAFASGRTCVIDCPVDRDEKVFPMIPPGRSGKDIIYG